MSAMSKLLNLVNVGECMRYTAWAKFLNICLLKRLVVAVVNSVKRRVCHLQDPADV